jgi:hypothetical protein
VGLLAEWSGFLPDGNEAHKTAHTAFAKNTDFEITRQGARRRRGKHGKKDYPFTTRYFFGLPVNPYKTSMRNMAFDGT